MPNSAMLIVAPALLSIAWAVDTTTPVTPVDDVVKQLLNLGVGGVIALIFYWQWRYSEKKREIAEERERRLLRQIAKLEVDTPIEGE